MAYYVSSAYVEIDERRDRSCSFSIRLYFLRDEPLNGSYAAGCLSPVAGKRFCRHDGSFSRILNLCTPSRLCNTSVNPCVMDFSSIPHSFDTLFSQTFSFHYAAELRSLLKALQFYGFSIDYDTILSELPF